jgi:S-DNA-T family DNA segregation ATPase FtsK/SpoIIIE
VAVVRFRGDTARPTVDDLTTRLGGTTGTGLAVDGRRIASAVPLGDAGLADGSRLETTESEAAPALPWVLSVIGGLDTGRSWSLPTGASLIGPGPVADIRLDDMADADAVTLHVDLDGSTTLVDAAGAHRAGPGDPLSVSRRTFTLSAPPRPPARPLRGTTIAIRPVVTPVEPPPAAPGEPMPPGAPPTAPPFSWIGVLAPLAMGGLVAVLWSPRFALFAAFGPVIVLGTWFEQRRRHRRDLTTHQAEIERRAREHRTSADHHQAAIAGWARRRLPALDVLAERARVGGSALWGASDPLEVSVGWDHDRPVEITLLGRTTMITGPGPIGDGVLRHFVVQLAVAHAPSALTIEREDDGGSESDWLDWLPHRPRPDSADGSAARLVVFGREILPTEPPQPDESHLLVLSDDVNPPPWVDTTLSIGIDGTGRVEYQDRDGAARMARPVQVAPIETGDAARVARHLARWREVTDGPTGSASGADVGLTEITGPLDDVAVLLDRWLGSADRPDPGLPAPVGVGSTGPLALDLVRDGPHVVIGGTTGSGKSELLRTLVASLCATHPPEAVTFVLVDYKGGSAFDGCADLPHVTTVVTDLDGSRTHRVLTAVDAELRRRERWLREQGRADLEAAADRADRPPRLVVIIDEFATLAHDQPDFLPSLVDVARRGRSLGLHLILATQRPAGAMTDDIRANTDLRIALRMVDPADSTDVIGVADAARIPADQPGRAIVRRAGGPTEDFQVALATTPPRADVDLDVRWVDGPMQGHPAERPDVRPGPTQLEHLVLTAGAAMARSARPPVAPIWPPELPMELTPEELDVSVGSGEPDTLTIGLVDDLTATRHQPSRWSPTHGVLALHGSHGADLSGVITGMTAAAHRRWGAVHVYGVDGPGELSGWTDADPVAAIVGAEHRDGVRRVVARLERVLRKRTAARPAPPILLVLHDHPAIARALDDLDGLRLLDRLHRLATEGPPRGFVVIVTSPRPGALPPTIAGTIDRRLVLRVAQPDDYRLIGLRPPASSPPPGRALDEHGTAVQLVRLEPADLARYTTTPPDGRPLPLDELPTLVVGEPRPIGVTPDPWLLPVGVDQDGNVDLPVTAGQATIVAGPPGAGRTTALRTIAVEARRRGTTVLVVAGRDEGPRGLIGTVTPIRPAELQDYLDDARQMGQARDGLVDTEVTTTAAEPAAPSPPSDPPVTADPDRDGGPGPFESDGADHPSAMASTDRHRGGDGGGSPRTGDPSHEARLLVMVDDATEVSDENGTLAALARGRLRPEGVRLVVSLDPVERRTAYGHWAAALRRCRSGIALHHDPDEDRDLWTSVLPPAPTGRRPPGRGLLLRDGEEAVEIQVARP